MAHHNFEKGDLVRLKTGTAPIVVTRVGGDAICGHYTDGQHQFPWRRATDFVRYERNPPEEPDMATPTDPLYSLKSDPTTMGRVIGTNHEGKKVFEVRPSNELKLVDSTDLEEVRPYTIRIGGAHYEAPKDVFSKGDVLLMPDDQLRAVDQTDTKCRNPSDLPKGIRRIPTEAVAY